MRIAFLFALQRIRNRDILDINMRLLSYLKSISIRKITKVMLFKENKSSNARLLSLKEN